MFGPFYTGRDGKWHFNKGYFWIMALIAMTPLVCVTVGCLKVIGFFSEPLARLLEAKIVGLYGEEVES